jgi:hypothetical protein
VRGGPAAGGGERGAMDADPAGATAGGGGPWARGRGRPRHGDGRRRVPAARGGARHGGDAEVVWWQGQWQSS